VAGVTVGRSSEVSEDVSAQSLRLSRYDPSDLSWFAAMVADENDLKLIWPEARFPFDVEQWRERLTRSAANTCYRVCRGDDVIGHAALLETEQDGIRSVSYLYIAPAARGEGLGSRLMTAIEARARACADIRALQLRVRTYNPRAEHIYRKAGFHEIAREGTLVIMRKDLH
jgi:ribosomal-protein-alanine N-acetyltransferase